RDQNQIHRSRGDADDGKRLAAVLFGPVLDLNELIDAKANCNRRRDHPEITTPADSNREDAADHRSYRQTLLRHVLWRWRRLPTGLHLLRRLERTQNKTPSCPT